MSSALVLCRRPGDGTCKWISYGWTLIISRVQIISVRLYVRGPFKRSFLNSYNGGDSRALLPTATTQPSPLSPSYPIATVALF